MSAAKEEFFKKVFAKFWEVDTSQKAKALEWDFAVLEHELYLPFWHTPEFKDYWIPIYEQGATRIDYERMMVWVQPFI